MATVSRQMRGDGASYQGETLRPGGCGGLGILVLSAVTGVMVLLSLAAFRPRVDWLALVLITVNLVLFLLPLAMQLSTKRVDPFQPVVWAGLYFGLPMFIVKGSILALNGEPGFLRLTPDVFQYLNLALACIAIGWMSLLIGFYMPWGRTLGWKVRLPHFMVTPSRLRLSAVLGVLLLGVGVDVLLIREGAFGSSLSEFAGNLNLVSVLRPLSSWFTMAFFLLVFGATNYRRAYGWRLSALVASAIAVGLSLLAGFASPVVQYDDSGRGRGLLRPLPERLTGSTCFRGWHWRG